MIKASTMNVRMAVLFAGSLALAAACFMSTPAVLADGRTKGGAEMWAANCRTCHTLRAPSSYSAEQWEIAVNHMRFRCGLTAKEARKIAEFLKNAN